MLVAQMPGDVPGDILEAVYFQMCSGEDCLSPQESSPGDHFPRWNQERWRLRQTRSCKVKETDHPESSGKELPQFLVT
jgi:hypothetical protein